MAIPDYSVSKDMQIKRSSDLQGFIKKLSPTITEFDEKSDKLLIAKTRVFKEHFTVEITSNSLGKSNKKSDKLKSTSRFKYYQGRKI